jgi:hypothetical protein
MIASEGGARHVAPGVTIFGSGDQTSLSSASLDWEIALKSGCEDRPRLLLHVMDNGESELLGGAGERHEVVEMG